MPGTEYLSDLKDRVHHLSSMDFSAEEIVTLLVIPVRTVYHTLEQRPGSSTAQHNHGGCPRKLSSQDVDVSSRLGCIDLQAEQLGSSSYRSRKPNPIFIWMS
jgi:hypothetical protein